MPSKGFEDAVESIRRMSGPQRPEESGIRWGVLIVTVLVVLSVLVGGTWLCCSRNPTTPAGYVGYLTQGAVFGSTEYVGTQVGPTSPGRGWLLDVVNVSVTPYTYSEVFSGGDSVLSKDRLMIAFAIHLTWRIRADQIRLFVEKYAYGDLGEPPDKLVAAAYANFLRESFRTFARDEVQNLSSVEISAEMNNIAVRVQARLKAMADPTPFEILTVVVGNVQFPPVVANAVAQKMATQQQLEQKQTEVAIAAKDAEIRVARARGEAQAMEIINAQLTPQYLQHEAIAVMATQQRTIYIPTGPMGIPLVGTFDTTPPARAPAP